MTVIVGVDGSTPSRAALAWAIGRAVDRSEPLKIMHVFEDEWGQLGPDYARDESTAGAGLVADAVRFARERMPDSAISQVTVHGSPAWELAAAARPEDLLVVGTHKTGHINGRVLGTRSVVVASVAQSSVAIIPDIAIRGRSGVVVGVADGDSWHDAVAAAAAEADRSGDALLLVHAGPAGREAERTLLGAASAFALAAAPSIPLHSRVSRRTPAEALLDASRAAALLVLGGSRRDPDGAGFIGSVTHEVLLNINVPVLVARRSAGA